jgi:hypothetical protein
VLGLTLGWIAAWNDKPVQVITHTIIDSICYIGPCPSPKLDSGYTALSVYSITLNPYWHRYHQGKFLYVIKYKNMGPGFTYLSINSNEKWQVGDYIYVSNKIPLK